jgi:hypothetical protein
MEGFLFLPAAMSPHLSDEGFFIANEEPYKLQSAIVK